MPKNPQLEDFRAEMRMVLSQHVEKMQLYLLRNPDPKALKAVMADPLSKWNLDWDALNRKMKNVTASIVNKIHSEAYLRGLK